MLSLLCVGDLHYKDSNVEESRKLNEFLLGVTEKLHPDLVVILGDILHSHRKLDSVLRHDAIEFFTELGKHARVKVLIGNHDRINNTDFLSPIHPFSGVIIPNVEFIWKVEAETVKEYQLVFVPYVYPGRFQEALNTRFTPETFSRVSAVFAHQEIRGVKMNSQASRVGDVWSREQPLLISGHIHQYQRLADNILYVGTPRMTDFGDSMDKTVSRVSLQRTDSGVGWTEERIEVPLKVKITLAINFGEINTITFAEPPGRISISGTREELATLKVNPKIAEWKKLGIKIQPLIIKIVKPLTVMPKESTQPFLTILRSVLDPDQLAHLDRILIE